MRSYEAVFDLRIPPGFHIVVRLDGRSFTRLTQEVCAFEAPFDTRFRDLMVVTARHLIDCGFNVLYGYGESDEISLLLHPEDTSFSRKARKYVSLLAGEASAAFSVALGRPASFDGRLSILPGREQVIDYFRWRMSDAIRCCLNGHAYWMLRRQGRSGQAASEELRGMGHGDKHELLFQSGVDFDRLPTWQKRGFGVYWAESEITGYHPKTGEATATRRRRRFTDFRLPAEDDYATALSGLLDGRPFPTRLWPPERIVSGGQTGADRAALDWAIAHNIPHGGWCPRGRRAEDSPIDARYALRETADSERYQERTWRNVIDSDGTLILNLGELDGGTLETLRFTERLSKPSRLVQLDTGVCEEDVREVVRWVAEHGIATLNLAGPRESKRPGIYHLTQAFLDALQNHRET
jgi:tRNA(His) 5'-end guanylyltransferase